MKLFAAGVLVAPFVLIALICGAWMAVEFVIDRSKQVVVESRSLPIRRFESLAPRGGRRPTLGVAWRA